MQRVARSVGCFLGFGWLVFCCWGCVSSGSIGKPSAADAQAQNQEYPSEKELPADTAPAKRADRLLGVQIKGQAQEAMILLTGNGPFRDYQLSRLGDRRFSLDLSDISNEAELPSLPADTEDVKLSYSNTSKGVEIVGSLGKTLDHYVLNNAGNNLALTLYFTHEAAPAAVAFETGSTGAKSNRSGASSEAGSSKLPANPSALPSADQTGTRQPLVRKLDAGRPRPGEAETPLLRKQYTGKPISLDLLDADLRNVLRLLADLTGTNIVIEPEVTGRVTMRVEQVPWDQVLDMALAMNGLGKEQVGNVIRIARQAKLRDEWKQQEEEIKAKQDLLEATKDLGEITTQYLTVNYTHPVEMAAKINEIKSDKGKISVDERTNLIIYTDYPARIDEARRLLARLDKAMPQVMIEARIVTMTDDLTRSIGVSWNFRLDDTAALNREFVVDLVSAAGSAFTLNLGQVIGQTLLSLDLNLSALETTTQAKIIAAPKVLTLNNVKAIISQGRQIPYLQQSTADVAAVSTVFKDAVVELQVTPHITPDKKVRLEIEAKQDEPDTTVPTSTGDPGISTRKIKTELLVSDGAIVVIGGVMRDTQGRALDTTPGLGRIPILGRLFKLETMSRSKEELLIFICPKIVEM